MRIKWVPGGYVGEVNLRYTGSRVCVCVCVCVCIIYIYIISMGSVTLINSHRHTPLKACFIMYAPAFCAHVAGEINCLFDDPVHAFNKQITFSCSLGVEFFLGKNNFEVYVSDATVTWDSGRGHLNETFRPRSLERVWEKSCANDVRENTNVKPRCFPWVIHFSYASWQRWHEVPHITWHYFLSFGA